MVEIEVENREAVAGMFQGHLGGYIPDAILEGHVGNVIADQETPQFAVLELPQVKLAILGGDPKNPLARHYLQNIPRFAMLLFATAGFASLARDVHPGKWVEMNRYAFSSEQLNIAKLRELKAQIPNGFQIEKIDLPLAKQLGKGKNKFAEAHGVLFNSPEDFVERGVGYCALEGDRIASVASSFVICEKGIEIQIDTRKKYRGRGVATAVAAHLMVHCLENNLNPGWDAANKISASFAEKLGYIPQGTYKMFIFTGSKLLVSLRDNIQRVRQFING